MVEEKQPNKYCSFYVSEMHLVVMLIPYIEKELEKGKKFATVLEEGLKQEVSTFIKKVNIGKSKKNKLKKINWDKNLLTDEQLIKLKNRIVLVQGTYEYIKEMNEKLENSKNIKIINCYRFEDFEDNSREILENHEAILNTLGVKRISEIFKKNRELKGILTK